MKEVREQKGRSKHSGGNSEWSTLQLVTEFSRQVACPVQNNEKRGSSTTLAPEKRRTSGGSVPDASDGCTGGW